MRLSDFRTMPRANPMEAWLALLGFCIALSPTSTKIAGAAWLLVCMAGAVALFKAPAPVRSEPHHAASKAWVVACAISAALATAMAAYWAPNPDTLHAEFRLLFAALATHMLVQRVPCPEKWRAYTLPAIALAFGAALLKVGATHNRDFLPSNAIPWAVAVAFFLCILLPKVLGGGMPATRRTWHVISVCLGFAAILMSQSRGAFWIFVWTFWLATAHWCRTHTRIKLQTVGVAGLLGVALVVSSAWVPADPLRLRQGWNEVVAATRTDDYNTSMGARVYNFSLAWDGFKTSPWVGIGGTERLRRIKEAGHDLPAVARENLRHVRELGHVHNQYLHAAMDGGLVGLAAVLAVLAGLGVSAHRLRRTDRVASRQMQGVLFMHVTAGLTNVNLAHNYYAVMLSLSVAVILAGGSCRADVPSGHV